MSSLPYLCCHSVDTGRKLNVHRLDYSKTTCAFNPEKRIRVKQDQQFLLLLGNEHANSIVRLQSDVTFIKSEISTLCKTLFQYQICCKKLRQGDFK